ncbi:MAG: D-alanyl-D-alanine carboxypeptidase [Bacteroidota bacterium]
MSSEFQHHTGFYLYDPEDRKLLIDHNGDRYFTPASNTKIFTLYAALNLLDDQLPGLYYKETRDSLIFWGTGDPSFLYRLLPQSDLLEVLAAFDKPLYFSTSNFHEKPLGPGWSWDDYLYTYSVERSPLPIYGNTVLVKKEDRSPYLTINQPFFKGTMFLGDSIIGQSAIVRDVGSNKMVYLPSLNEPEFELEIPYRYSSGVVAALLSDTLKKPVKTSKTPLTKAVKTKYSIPTDSALKVMMQESDNFIAEQLLLVSAGIISDSLNTDIAIQHVKSTFLKDIPDEPQWVDGSGLSRYNLFTPRSIVWLWDRLLSAYGKERLFPLLAAGGVNGTLKNYYRSPEPYIFGKTGTLSNNHALSGYLITESGKTLIFSFMNNNYPTESYPIKKKMEEILWQVSQNY